uniref:hypothetical protein n=1 Tax=Gelidibacter sp. TaxID=2018083 RepID=UPI0040498DA9
MIKTIMIYVLSGVLLSFILHKMANFKIEDSIFIGIGASLLTFLGVFFSKKIRSSN